MRWQKASLAPHHPSLDKLFPTSGCQGQGIKAQAATDKVVGGLAASTLPLAECGQDNVLTSSQGHLFRTAELVGSFIYHAHSTGP